MTLYRYSRAKLSASRIPPELAAAAFLRHYRDEVRYVAIEGDWYVIEKSRGSQAWQSLKSLNKGFRPISRRYNDACTSAELLGWHELRVSSRESEAAYAMIKTALTVMSVEDLPRG